MVDFHTHILPNLDDGSKSLEESLEMLRLERAQGIDTVVLSPHYYSSQYCPEEFLQRRQRSWERLVQAVEPGMPRLLPGAEVQFFESIANFAMLPEFCIRGTNLLLLEMPFCHWDDRVVGTVLELNGSNGIQLVLAHIERYLSFGQNAKTLSLLRRAGILMQVNSSFFAGWLRRQKALGMFRRGEFQLIGSDCHNNSTRRPDWQAVPQEVLAQVSRYSSTLLEQSPSIL